MCPWPPKWAKVHISVKELFPLVLACALWGHQWRGKVVSCLSDNTAEVAILRSGISRQESAMHSITQYGRLIAHCWYEPGPDKVHKQQVLWQGR